MVASEGSGEGFLTGWWWWSDNSAQRSEKEWRIEASRWCGCTMECDTNLFATASVEDHDGVDDLVARVGSQVEGEIG